MKQLFFLFTVLCFLGAPEKSFAKNGREHGTEVESHHSSSSPSSPGANTPVQTGRPGRLEARLLPISGTTLTGDGRVRSENKVQHRRSRYSIQANIHVTPGTFAQTPGNLLVLHITRAGTLFAVCTPTLGQVDDEDGVESAEYRLNLQAVQDAQGNLFSAARSGVCDIDPLTDGVQTGFPLLQAGDVLTVDAISAGGTETFLSGTLARKH